MNVPFFSRNGKAGGISLNACSAPTIIDFIIFVRVRTYQLYLLSVMSGLLLGFSWFPNSFLPLIFIAFVPLLMAEQEVFSNPYKHRSITLFVCSYLTFFLWNIISTWWVKNASFGGAAMAILCNALLMSMVFMTFHSVKKRIGEKWSYLIFISFWLGWEYFHLNWHLSWPWLTLGNVFADFPSIIQWYEFTGVFGGSLWILTVNLLLFSCISYNGKFSFRVKGKKSAGLLALLILPILISFALKPTVPAGDMEVVIIQPNIDPYNEKFTGSPDDQLRKMLQMAAEKITDSTEYVVFPETAIVDEIWENEMNESSGIQLLNSFLLSFPDVKIIIGASTSRYYKAGETPSATARKFTQEAAYYDSYNTALQLDSTGKVQIYHKSKLVPGVEKMPFPFIFKHLSSLAIDLGGTTGSLGMQDERTVFTSEDPSMKAAPVVCYESIYGEYVGDYINNGAQFIAIITNDGWWGDTPGYKQHLKYGALRAIETRKWIVRSANTGISCFIDPAGTILQPTSWWVPAALSGKISLVEERTFYTRFGDYIALAAVYLAVLLLVYSWLIRFRMLKK
ncbi:MAG: apolipoprotein N-acyltransferase [Bacteroidota bacterium]|nr:apolipoprotein N-acyltransferase [Bacteroidota bacterium]